MRGWMMALLAVKQVRSIDRTSRVSILEGAGLGFLELRKVLLAF